MLFPKYDALSYIPLSNHLKEIRNRLECTILPLLLLTGRGVTNRLQKMFSTVIGQGSVTFSPSLSIILWKVCVPLICVESAVVDVLPIGVTLWILIAVLDTGWLLSNCLEVLTLLEWPCCLCWSCSSYK